MHVREVDPSKVRLRGLLEAAPDAIFVTDADDTVVMVNAQMERLFARSRTELIGQAGKALFPSAFQPIYNSYHNAFYYAVLPAPERTSAELWGRGPDGREFPLEITMSPLETESGKMVTNVIRDISERKRMEAALRESEARFRRLAENAQDVIYRCRLWPAFAVEYVSPAVTAVCGYRPDEFYADRDLALRCVHPQDVAQVHAFIETRQLPSGPLALRMIHKDGAVVWTEQRMVAVRDGTGGIVAVEGIVRDITEARYAERRQEVQYAVSRILSEASTFPEAALRILETICNTLGWPVGALWLLDPSQDRMRCVEFWHPSSFQAREFESASREITFRKGEGFIGSLWAQATPLWIPDISALANFRRSPSALRDGLRTAAGFPIKLGREVLGVVEFFDTEIRPADENLLEMMGALGSQIGRFIGAKRTEDALRESEERYRMLFERNPHPMWVFDRETLRFLAVNDTAIRRYGYSREEFLSMTLRDIRPPEDVPAMVQKFAQDVQGIFDAGVWRHRKKDGEIVFAEIVSHDLMFAGRPARLVLANDVTRRKLAEEALRETNAELSAYQSLITHDIGNFTMALLGITEYLLQKKDGGLTDKQDEFLRRANRQGMEMFRLVENARLLVRLREKGLPASVEPVCLGEAFERAVATVRTLHFDRPFRFSIEGPKEVAVCGVPLLDNIILNLVDNAVRHTSRSVQPVVRVQICEEGEFVLISIRGGAPPDDETCSGLFRRYHKGRHSSGSGLGLALVGEIVRRVNGTIEARRADEPEGPAFEVVMRLKKA